MIKRKTWKLSERPDSYGKKRASQHPPAKKWEEISHGNQLLFKAAADEWRRKTERGNVLIYAYGSRVNGDFRPDSDIDIAVEAEISTEPGCTIKPCPMPKFKMNVLFDVFDVDVKMVQPDPTIHYIEIPI